MPRENLYVTLLIFFVLAAFGKAAPAYSSEEPNFSFVGERALAASVSSIVVHVADNVMGSCLMNANQIEIAAQLSLRRYGFEVVEAFDDQAMNNQGIVFFEFTGGRSDSNFCFGSFSADLIVFANVQVQVSSDPGKPWAATVANMKAVSYGQVVVGPDSFDTKAREWTEGISLEVANHILSSRLALARDYPQYKEYFLGLSENIRQLR